MRAITHSEQHVMSIRVPLEDLASTLQQYPWGYLVTVDSAGRARVLAVPTVWRNGVLWAEAGRSSRENAQRQPEITLTFPGTDGTAYSLVVDGRASVTADGIEITPLAAVLHRPALKT